MSLRRASFCRRPGSDTSFAPMSGDARLRRCDRGRGPRRPAAAAAARARASGRARRHPAGGRLPGAAPASAWSISAPASVRPDWRSPRASPTSPSRCIEIDPELAALAAANAELNGLGGARASGGARCRRAGARLCGRRSRARIGRARADEPAVQRSGAPASVARPPAPPRPCRSRARRSPAGSRPRRGSCDRAAR